jgi:hypothetical protein
MAAERSRSVRKAAVEISTKPVVKTTLIVTDVLNRNLEIYSAMHGMTKNDAVVKCIEDQLSAKGFRPNQYPVDVIYR